MFLTYWLILIVPGKVAINKIEIIFVNLKHICFCRKKNRNRFIEDKINSSMVGSSSSTESKDYSFEFSLLKIQLNFVYAKQPQIVIWLTLFIKPLKELSHIQIFNSETLSKNYALNLFFLRRWHHSNKRWSSHCDVTRNHRSRPINCS